VLGGGYRGKSEGMSCVQGENVMKRLWGESLGNHDVLKGERGVTKKSFFTGKTLNNIQQECNSNTAISMQKETWTWKEEGR